MAQDETVGLAPEDTHIPSIDDDASYDEPAEETTEVSDQEQQSEEQPEEPDGGKYGFGDPELDGLIDAAAKRIGHLDPNNPDHLKTLRSFAEKDRMIAKFKAIEKNFDPSNPDHAKLARELFGTKDGEEPGEEETSTAALTEFEKSLAEKAGGESPEKSTNQKTVQDDSAQTAAQDAEDAGKAWKSPADAYHDLTGAWAEIQENIDKAHKEGRPYTPDYSKINAIETALLDRRLESMVAPVLQEFQERINQINERFGGVLPDLERTVSQQRLASTKTFALAELQKTGRYEGIDKMFEANPDGPPITINGEKFSNSPFHKAVATAPWIMDIHAKGKDQQSTERLTMIARLRAAHQVLNGTAKSRESVKRALQAGQQLTERNREDRVRQSLNSGAGTNSFESGQKETGYIGELNSSEEMSVDDL